MRKLDEPIRSVVIAGGGNIGVRLAQALEDSNDVKLIERQSERAKAVSESEKINKTMVLKGDATDETFLLEENIDSADVFVSVTNADEANILSAMLAKRLGAHKVMAVINKPAYTESVSYTHLTLPTICSV